MYIFDSYVSLPGKDVLCWLLSYPLLSVCFPCFFFCVSLRGKDVLYWLLSCSLLSVCFPCLFFLRVPSWQRCPLLATFLFASFCLLSLLFFLRVPSWQRCPLLATLLSDSLCLLSLHFFLSDRVAGSIWFGSFYLVTTAGFVADRLM